MRSFWKCWSLLEKDSSGLSLQLLICCRPPMSTGQPSASVGVCGTRGVRAWPCTHQFAVDPEGLSDQQIWGIKIRSDRLNVRRETHRMRPCRCGVCNWTQDYMHRHTDTHMSHLSTRMIVNQSIFKAVVYVRFGGTGGRQNCQQPEDDSTARQSISWSRVLCFTHTSTCRWGQ